MKNSMLMRQTSSKGMSKDQHICRICLSEEEPDNCLISPCSCTGSMKYIHETCLKEWLEGKKHMKETEWVNSYIWKNLECEICKTSYADLQTI
jgi:E3 ubiquitin-protein ligase DOA10